MREVEVRDREVEAIKAQLREKDKMHEREAEVRDREVEVIKAQLREKFDEP